MMTREQLQPGNGANYDIIYGWAPCRVKGKVRVDLFLLSWMKNGGSGGVSVIVSQRFTRATLLRRWVLTTRMRGCWLSSSTSVRGGNERRSYSKL